MIQIIDNQIVRDGATVGALEVINGQVYFVPEGDNLNAQELSEILTYMGAE